MTKKKKIDPTLPFTEVEMPDGTYKLCFTFRALAAAEAKLRRMGIAANMLRMLPNLSFENIPVVLLAGLLTFHPEMTLEKVVDLIDWDTVWDAGRAIEVAWAAAFPQRVAGKGEKENPPVAVPS